MGNWNELLVNLAAKVGIQSNADGTLNAIRGGKTGEMIVQQAHGRLYEAASRKKMFYSHCTAVALSAANTSAVGNIIWNPPDSGVLLALGPWAIGYLATDADALAVYLGQSAQSAVPGSTTAATTYGCTYLGAAGNLPAARCYSIATITTAPAAVFYMARHTAAIATTGETYIQGDFQGGIIVPPGYLVTPFAAAAHAASGVSISITWEEIPIV